VSHKKSVLVAMSGGVDSSVTAALLKEQGYNLIGVTMQLGTNDETNSEGSEECCNISAIEDARQVAHRLEIPFYVVNFRELFQEKVVDYFLNEYLEGKTPNPCIACNRHVKFSALFNKAVDLGVDFIATGHYARIFYDPSYGRYLMKKAEDRSKDQTYVLYGLSQDKLSKILMPLGEYTKSDIRIKAKELGLSVAEKPESQEICFITDNNYRRFIKEKAGNKIKPGPYLDTKGHVIGRHKGLPYYTVGQRKGLGLALGKPIYVIDIDPERNAIIIGDNEDLMRKSLISGENNFILFDRLDKPMEVMAKIRYKTMAAPAVISPLEDGRVKVDFQEPQRAITPGQAVVYYWEEFCLGGGIIEKTL
jgi:tRNA-specific 2-thiouridylase